MLYISYLVYTGLIIFIILVIFLSYRTLLHVEKSNFKEESLKLLWTIIIFNLPGVGVLLYYLIGRNQRGMT